MSVVAKPAADWLGRVRTSIIAWWIPKGIIIATLFAPVAARALVWAIVLIWMGAACVLNTKRCGRTHCRYTGPFYLAMILPVLVLASGLVPVSSYGWLALAVFILCGGWVIWWVTERAWGKFS